MEKICLTKEFAKNLKDIIDEDIVHIDEINETLIKQKDIERNYLHRKKSESAREILKKVIAQMDNYSTDTFCIAVGFKEDLLKWRKEDP